MTFPQLQNMENLLLSLLSQADYDAIAGHARFLELPRGYILAQAGKQIESVYFLTAGIGSVIVTTREGHRAEAGLFGFDGYVPTSAVAGVETSSYDVTMQVAGQGYAVAYDRFRERMETSRSFSRVMIRAIEAFSVQLASTAVTNAVHEINQRLARWLLMCDDRISGSEIALTHEFLSVMLAVRRPSVTTSLHVLEGLGLIRSLRNNIVIRDRKALEAYAGGAYGWAEQEYRRLMQDLNTKASVQPA